MGEHGRMVIFARSMIDSIFNQLSESVSLYNTNHDLKKEEDPGESAEQHIPTLDLRPSCSSAGWERLPSEIWLFIFSHISQAELYYNTSKVSKGWRSLSLDSSLWRNVDFNKMHEDLVALCETSDRDSVTFPRSITDSIFQDIILGLRTQIVSLKMSRFLGDFILEEANLQFLCLCKNIVSLDLGFSESMDLKTICRNCHSIQELNVEGSKKLEDSDFSEITLLENLNKLNVSHCAMLSDHFLIYLFELKRLRALFCDGLLLLTDCGVKAFLSKQPSLETLILDGEDMSDEVACFAAKNLPHLVTFELSFCQNLTSSSILAFRGKQQMEKLQFRKATNISGSSICRFFDRQSFFNLKKFTLTECEDLRDNAVVALSESCPLLEFLMLDWCWKITDLGIQAIVNSCRLMKEMSLVGLFALTGDSWIVGLEVNLPHLYLLDLTDCNDMVDEELVELVQRKPTIAVYSYFHERIIVPSTDNPDSSEPVTPVDDKMELEWKCPGELEARVDF